MARLSFLSLFFLFAGLAALAWVVYFVVKYRRAKWNADNANASPLPPPLSPSQLWMKALTQYPRWFLGVSVFIPLLLSIMGLARSGGTVKINLDFDTYLAIDSDLDRIARNLDMAQKYQEQSAEDPSDVYGIKDSMICDVFGRVIAPDRQLANQLDTSLYLGEGDSITITYQNQKGGNVFTPEVLQDIYDFEQSILDFPSFEENCFRIATQPQECFPLDSLAARFFQNGNMVSNPDDVLRSFLTSRQDISKVDQYFGTSHLESNITKTRVLLRSVGRGKANQALLHPFLEKIYRGLFWQRDQNDPYPNMIFTWENKYLLEYEKNDATLHDTLWSIGSLLFIALMILLKVQDVFVVFFALLGLLLAFSASYYWCLAHFDIQEITLLHISGLFVMLGIGADDIFLMIDSYDHSLFAAADFSTEDNHTGTHAEDDVTPAVDPAKRMAWAYSTAGSMMLVSSTTTAVCFFSNAFGNIKVVQQLGIFMGMVIICNYVHVMTILPSAILVNEIYFKPWRLAFMARRSKPTDDPVAAHASQEERVEPTTNATSLVAWRLAFMARWRNDRDPRASDTGAAEQVAVVEPEEAPTDPNSPAGDQASVESGSAPAPGMNRLDRWLTERYAPFVTKRRYVVIWVSILFALIMVGFGMATFKQFNGSIVLFSEKYNFGRQTILNDKYYSYHLDQEIERGPTPPPTTLAPSLAPVTLPPGETYAPTGPLVTASFGGEPAPTPQIQPGIAFSGGGGGSGNDGSAEPNIWVPSQNLSPYQQFFPPEEDLQRKESIVVQLIWGIESAKDSNMWLVEDHDKQENKDQDEPVMFSDLQGIDPAFDLPDPNTQQWLFDVVQYAREDQELNVQPSYLTWIEELRNVAVADGVGFPVPTDLFRHYAEVVVCRNTGLETSEMIGTDGSGLEGDILYATITIRADVVRTGDSLSLSSFKKWSRFAETVNGLAPPGMVPVVAQSDLFWNGYRSEETVNSTVQTWLIANGLCFAIILLFTQNLLLCVMVLVTLLLIFFCITGWLFAFFGLVFGPVEALGVSIFIGLSANYALHAAHAYHRAKGNDRESKVQEAVFITGSPILASALSTLGGTAFLFGCRTFALVELGILIFCVTGMALVYSMGFLLASLLVIGPLPYDTVKGHDDDDNHRRLHQCDIYALCYGVSSRMTNSAKVDMNALCYGIFSRRTNSAKDVVDKDIYSRETNSGEDDAYRAVSKGSEDISCGSVSAIVGGSLEEELPTTVDDALLSTLPNVFNSDLSNDADDWMDFQQLDDGNLTASSFGCEAVEDPVEVKLVRSRSLPQMDVEARVGCEAAQDTVEVHLKRSLSLQQMDTEANSSFNHS